MRGCLWLLLMAATLPLAALALIVYPIVWLITLPFSLLLDLDLDGVLELVYAILTLPKRVLDKRLESD